MKSNILDTIDLTLTPYLKTPISLIGDTRIQWIIALAPTQSGKTVLLQVAVADAVDQDPGPMLYLLPDENMGKKNLQEKVINMLVASPELATHFTGRIRDLSKSGIELDNMTIMPGWAGSLATTSSIPQKRVCIDEARLMKLTVGNESNAIQTGEDRLTTYFKMGLGQGYIVSSPSVEGDLLNNQLDVANTSVWRWKVPCPNCSKFQVLDFFKNIVWSEKEERARCLCQFCGAEFTDKNDKRDWNNMGVYCRLIENEDGKWEDTYIDEEGNAEYPFEISSRMAFWWGSMDSPFRTFHMIWNKYVQTKDKLHDYKHFIQCWLAQFWQEDVSKTSISHLKTHCKPYDKGDVPSQVKVLTLGIDTQDDGLYCVVRGFGAKKYSALIDEYFISCPIDDTSETELIKIITRDVMGKIYLGENSSWTIGLAAIDTGGHRTKELYRLAANFPKLLLIKGRDTQNTRYSYNKELNLYLVRTCEYLEETEIKCNSDEFVLPRNVSNDYLMQFCNSRKVKEYNKRTGEEKVIWKKIGRNDFRMADVHAWICLDIPTSRGVFRNEVEKEEFKYNPFSEKQELAKKRSERIYKDDDEQGFVNTNNWW